MSIISDFEEYKKRLNSEISNICQKQLLDETHKVIADQAKAVVYDAYSTEGFRRHSLEDEKNYKDKYYQSGDTHTIEVETNLSFQGTPWSPDLAVVITAGLPNFHQPFPRPWMQRAENIMQDKAQGLVTSELISRGF